MEAVILIGVQGAGKTTYFEQNLAATHIHISLDILGTRERELRLIDECIASRRDFAVDDTNLSRSHRATVIRRAKAAGYRVTGYYFARTARVAIGRNNHRTDKKPISVPAILAAIKRLEPPALDEGFDDLREV